jgi:hypothetical protein
MIKNNKQSIGAAYSNWAKEFYDKKDFDKAQQILEKCHKHCPEYKNCINLANAIKKMKIKQKQAGK